MSTTSDEMTSNQVPETSVAINEEKLIEDYVARQQCLAIQKKRGEIKESFNELNEREIETIWTNNLAAAKWHLREFGSFSEQIKLHQGPELSRADIEGWFRKPDLESLYLKTNVQIAGPLYSSSFREGQGSSSQGVDTIEVLKIRIGIYQYSYNEDLRTFIRNPEQHECPSR